MKFSKEKDYNIKLVKLKKFDNYELILQNLDLKNYKNYNVVAGKLEIKNIMIQIKNILNPEIRIYKSPENFNI